jgi:hypothetical protein
MTQYTDHARSRYAALQAERRDLIAAHRTLLDLGITSQTGECFDRLMEIERETDELTRRLRALGAIREALP